MGYTHYWKKLKDVPQTRWNLFTNDVHELVGDAPNLLCNDAEGNNSLPIVNDTYISFNGRGEDAHETFYLSRYEEDFAFCKTAQKPYDVYVVAVLALARLHFGEYIHFSSDGGEDELAGGMAIAREYFSGDFTKSVRKLKLVNAVL